MKPTDVKIGGGSLGKNTFSGFACKTLRSVPQAASLKVAMTFAILLFAATQTLAQEWRYTDESGTGE